MRTLDIEIGELKIGDEFEDVSPGTNGGRYIVATKASVEHRFIEAFPVWDKHAENPAEFHVHEIVRVEVGPMHRFF